SPVKVGRTGVTGGMVSLTITVWFAELLLPLPSLNVQCTVKVPWLLYVNESLVVPVMVPAIRSDAIGTGTVAEHCPVTVAKTGATGGVTSSTITVWLAVLMLPWP